jgi:hypothetical protein
MVVFPKPFHHQSREGFSTTPLDLGLDRVIPTLGCGYEMQASDTDPGTRVDMI